MQLSYQHDNIPLLNEKKEKQEKICPYIVLFVLCVFSITISISLFIYSQKCETCSDYTVRMCYIFGWVFATLAAILFLSYSKTVQTCILFLFVLIFLSAGLSLVTYHNHCVECSAFTKQMCYDFGILFLCVSGVLGFVNMFKWCT